MNQNTRVEHFTSTSRNVDFLRIVCLQSVQQAPSRHGPPVLSLPCPLPPSSPPALGPGLAAPPRLHVLSRNQTSEAPGSDPGWEKHRDLSGLSSSLPRVRLMNEESK